MIKHLTAALYGAEPSEPPKGRQRIMKMKTYEVFCCGFLNQGTVLRAFNNRFGYSPNFTPAPHGAGQ
jgi:hypothetical protein